MDCLTKDLRELYERAKGYQQNQAPYPCYSTGLTDGFYGGVRYVFDKIAEQSNEPLTLEELREMAGEPVWCKEYGIWGIIKIQPAGSWANKPFLVGAWHHPVYKTPVNFEYDIEGRELTLYRRRPEEGTV